MKIITKGSIAQNLVPKSHYIPFVGKVNKILSPQIN